MSAAPPAAEAESVAMEDWFGVAESMLGRLAKLDIHRPEDLLLHLPLRYEDETRLTPIAELRVGDMQQLEGEITHAEVCLRPRRQLLAHLRDDSGELVARWLHFYPSLQKQLVAGQRVRLFGELRLGFRGMEMVHPRLRVVKAGEALAQTLTPVYPTTAGLSQPCLRRLIAKALAQQHSQEYLSQTLLNTLGLPDFATALRMLHHPAGGESLASLSDRTHPAWQRIKFEELLVQQLALRRANNARRQKKAPQILARCQLGKALLQQLPFALTAAQQRVVAEISQDLAAAHPMQRLLHGDVGSGKTVVAALAMLQAFEQGWQAVLMAPTELLAEQHYHKLTTWLAPLGITVGWLVGSLRKRERESSLAALASGDVLLAVGTHALLEEAVVFPRLGLAIVDEQHRFGVRQRLALSEKNQAAALCPHLLMMSATPIPRTLAMTYYADLDVSVLDELPPGRVPVQTRLLADTRREQVIERVRTVCASGQQVYWVCPLIEESEVLQLQTAVDTYQALVAQLPSLRIGLVHGRLKSNEKTATMTAFADGELDLLVATTVIEVGVDVANASLMVIEHAERFGLAQLHQLRGRVGRSAHQSTCILLFSQPLSAQARARLKAIYEQQDGFAIAQEDLRIRGPGEFVGARQSGLPLLRHADLACDAGLVAPARQLAERLLRDEVTVVDSLITRWLGDQAGLMGA